MRSACIGLLVSIVGAAACGDGGGGGTGGSNTAGTGGSNTAGSGGGNTAGSGGRAGTGAVPCTGPNCPIVLVSGQDPSAIATDGVNVYWENWIDSAAVHELKSVPVGGGTTKTLARVDIVRAMVVRGGTLYWLSYELWKLPLDGTSQPVELVRTTAGGTFAVDDNYAYWCDISGEPIHKTPVGGGTTIELVTGGINAVSIATDGANVYWTDRDFANGSVVSVPVGGGTPTALVMGGFTNPGSIATDGTYVYYADYSNLTGTRIAKVPVGGGTPTVVAETTGAEYAMVIDATHAYWVEINGNVKKVPLAGGAVVTLATGQAQPIYIAVDNANVYWLNTGTDAGAVMKIAK